MRHYDIKISLQLLLFQDKLSDRKVACREEGQKLHPYQIN